MSGYPGATTTDPAKPPASPPTTTTHNMIWYDPNMDSNQSAKNYVEPLFNKCTYTKDLEIYKMEVEDSPLPVFTISCGGKYSSGIGEFAEGHPKVDIILIYCQNVPFHKEKMKNCPGKIRGVVDSEVRLVDAISEAFAYLGEKKLCMHGVVQGNVEGEGNTPVEYIPSPESPQYIPGSPEYVPQYIPEYSPEYIPEYSPDHHTEGNIYTPPHPPPIYNPVYQGDFPPAPPIYGIIKAQSYQELPPPQSAPPVYHPFPFHAQPYHPYHTFTEPAPPIYGTFAQPPPIFDTFTEPAPPIFGLLTPNGGTPISNHITKPYVEDCNLIWYEPDMKEAEQEPLKPPLEALFNKCLYSRNKGNFDFQIGKSESSVIALCSAERYHKIQNLLEANLNLKVIMIYIYTNGTTQAENYTKEYPKVTKVIPHIEEFLEAIKVQFKLLHGEIQDEGDQKEMEDIPNIQQKIEEIKEIQILEEIKDKDIIDITDIADIEDIIDIADIADITYSAGTPHLKMPPQAEDMLAESNTIYYDMISEEEEKEQMMYNMIWLDMDINSKENTELRQTIESYFNSCSYVANSKTFQKQLLNSNLPVVIISSGGLYESEIAEIAEGNKKVEFIIIYCKTLEYHLSKLKRAKVVGVVNTQDSLKSKIKEEIEKRSVVIESKGLIKPFPISTAKGGKVLIKPLPKSTAKGGKLQPIKPLPKYKAKVEKVPNIFNLTTMENPTNANKNLKMSLYEEKKLMKSPKKKGHKHTGTQNTEISEIAKNYDLIWLEPNITEDSYKIAKTELKSLFSNCTYIKKFSDLKSKVAKAGEPIILIICGEMYSDPDISKTIETAGRIKYILIHTEEQEKYKNLSGKHWKVGGVVGNMDELKDSLIKGVKFIDRLSKRYGGKISKEKTFYTLQEQQIIVDCQGVVQIFHSSETNIFYPLYFSGYDLEKEEWEQMLKGMEAIADIDPKLTKSKLKTHLFKVRIKELRNNPPSIERLIKSYTKNGLYEVFNEYFRLGEEYLSAFKYYAFCMRGAMCTVGDYIQDYMVSYRGLILSEEFFKLWVGAKSQIVLLPAYTSTSMNKEFAAGFNNSNTLITFKFISDHRQFKEQLNIFSHLWNGFYYPVDIHQYSQYPIEREILFPPFYPIKILSAKRVTGVKGGSKIKYSIVVVAPTFLNIGVAWSSLYEERSGMNSKMLTAYAQKMIDLLNNKMISQLDFSKKMVTLVDEDVRKSLFHAISQSKTLKLLDLNENYQLREEYIGAVTFNKHLQTLILNKCILSDDAMKALAEGMKINKSITKLKLTLNSLKSTALTPLCHALMKNTHLKILILGFNVIDDDGAMELNELLKVNKSIIKLDLQKNSLTCKGLIFLGNALETNHTLQNLNLSYNELITDLTFEEGIKVFCNSLAKNKSLLSLNLSKGQLHWEAAKYFGEYLESNPPLQTLILYENKFQEELEPFTKSLALNTNLKVLEIQNNGFRDEVGVQFAEALKSNKSLRTLKIGNNQLKGKTSRSLLETLKINTTLKELDLSYTTQKEAGIGKAFSEYLVSKHSTLVYLALDGCNLGDIECSFIAQSLEKNKSLEYLSVLKNKTEKETLTAFTIAVPKNKTLKKLLISNLKYTLLSKLGAGTHDEETEKQIRIIIKENQILKYLNLSDWPLDEEIKRKIHQFRDQVHQNLELNLEGTSNIITTKK